MIMRLAPLAAYGAVLGLSAFAISWLQLHHAIGLFPTEGYVVCIALAFATLGIWAGRQMTPPHSPIATAKPPAHGISTREQMVLSLLAQGQTNKEIARTLDISPNTVKTHVSRLFEKLGVQRRTQALHRARSLGLLD